MAGSAAPAAGIGGVWVLGDAPTVRAFALAGLRGRVVDSEAEGCAALEQARAAGVTLLVLTEELARRLGDERLAAGLRPILAVVPSAAGPRVEPRPAERLSRVVRRALGLPAERRSRGSG
jgi:vacuolar-type H+-ATPase subunit F/Vma7